MKNKYEGSEIAMHQIKLIISSFFKLKLKLKQKHTLHPNVKRIWGKKWEYDRNSSI